MKQEITYELTPRGLYSVIVNKMWNISQVIVEVAAVFVNSITDVDVYEDIKIVSTKLI